MDSETTVVRKVAWRLVPFLCIAYIINALDRYNVSIAALTMNKDLGLSVSAYGLAAGGIFLELCALPGAGEPDPAKDRRPCLAFHYHGLLGDDLGGHGLGYE